MWLEEWLWALVFGLCGNGCWGFVWVELARPLGEHPGSLMNDRLFFVDIWIDDHWQLLELCYSFLFLFNSWGTNPGHPTRKASIVLLSNFPRPTMSFNLVWLKIPQ